MEIKFGGSGDISTKSLEEATEKIIRARTAHLALSIDSNFIINLIQEVLDNRSPTYVSEYMLESESEFDEDDEDEEDEIELRRPLPPKRKKPSVRLATNEYWLDSPKARIIVGILLIILITIPILVVL